MASHEAKIDWVKRLAKWRIFFAGWQLGTRLIGDPECDAVRDHREVTLMLRAENNALVQLLVSKGVFSADEFSEQLNGEAFELCERYRRRYPGVEAADDGLRFDGRAAETMKNFRS